MLDLDTPVQNGSIWKGECHHRLGKIVDIAMQDQLCDGDEDDLLHRHSGALRNLGILTASIAHEVNQPLAAIQMNAETAVRLLSSREPNFEKAKMLVMRIAENVRRANQIVQRVRAIAANRPSALAPQNLNQIINCTIPIVQHELDRKSIKLQLDLYRNLPSVIGDEVHLQQVINNLLINSIQAIGQDASCPRIEVKTFVDGDRSVVCSIRDTGPGIAENDVRRIFEMFFTTKAAGMGAGLAISRSIVAAHGGGISASNHPGGGAEFRFWLPSQNS